MELRLATPDDAPAVQAIYRPYVERTAVSFETEAPSADEVAQRIDKALSRWSWVVAEEAGAVLGYAYAGAFAERAAYGWSVTCSVYVGDRAQRRGLGRQLYDDLFVRLAARGFCRAYAGIALPNAASVGLHTAMGFTPVGVYHRVGWKFGRWHDVGWFERALRDDEPPPARV